MNKKYTQWFWFIGGFTLGFTLIAIGHAAIPKKAVIAPRAATNLTELRAPKVLTPEMDQDFAKLTSLESKYAESLDQQKRLKSATARNVRKSRN